MSETNAPEVSSDDVQVDEGNLATWASFIHLQKVEEAIQALTPIPWRVLPDPQREGTFYVAGPPETRVVMEGMTEEDANNLVYLVNNLPEAVEHFEDLAQLWDALTTGEPDTVDRFDEYLEVIQRYQLHIAQLEGTPAVVPQVTTAGDINFMHIGSFLKIPSLEDREPTYRPISLVADRDEFMEIVLAPEPQMIIYLPKSMPVTVEVPDNKPLQMIQPTDPVEEEPEE